MIINMRLADTTRFVMNYLLRNYIIILPMKKKSVMKSFSTFDLQKFSFLFHKKTAKRKVSGRETADPKWNLISCLINRFRTACSRRRTDLVHDIDASD